MAAMRSKEASSSTSPGSYYVFLSFRGEDTRNTFTSHLYTALNNAGFRTFLDDDGIERGEEIKAELEKAIIESRMSIVVLSKSYASSSWCLDELVMILKRRSTSGHVVLPIFYDVDPSHVRKQMGSFEEAFAWHQGKIEAESGERRKEWMSKVEGWRAALRQVADLAGMDLQKTADGNESKFIKKIIKVVGDKLSRTILDIGPHVIGIESRAREIQFWIEDESTDVKVAAIWGMGGIGKTTVAKFLYNLNFSRFQGSSFLANVRETSKKQDGLLCLQRQLISDILKGRKEKISNVDQGIVKIRDALCFKRVLVILDDVDDQEQLYQVLGMGDFLFPGSKIIITTQNEDLIRAQGGCKVHKIRTLDYIESLELFSLHAFRQRHPIDDYADMSNLVIRHCAGLPLAIKILGSPLFGKSIGVWKSQLEKLEAIPDGQILEKIKISYDSLQDDHDKSLFLHIACFFVGNDKEYITTIMDGCEFHTEVGIQNLTDRCLLTIDNSNKVAMHHLLQEMGREIVRQESPNDPGERSRLYKHKDSFNVLRHNTGTRKIEGFILDMNLLKEDTSARPRTMFGVNGKCSLETNAFAKMVNLKLLHLAHVQISGNFENFPEQLRWLCWPGFPFESIPRYFSLEALVVLEMPYSRLKHFNHGTMFLELLKILNLSHSHSLAKTPDFIVLPNLERLILEDCTSLVEIHESIGDLARLVVLNLKDCSNLRKLPRSIGMLKSLETLDISGCSNLENLPNEMGNLDSLKVLRAENVTGITRSPTSIQNGKAWYSLRWLFPLRLNRNPETSWVSSLPRSLVKLNLEYCNLSEDVFPTDMGNLSSLRKLNLSNNPITCLPDCIRGMTGLGILRVNECTRLRSLVVPQDIFDLSFAKCSSLEKVKHLSALERSHDEFSLSMWKSLPFWEKARLLPGLNKLMSLWEEGSLILQTHYAKSSLTFCRAGDCGNLVEFSGMYKLEPLGDVDREILDNLGLFDMESMRNQKVSLEIPKASTRELFLQGCHEKHVFSTYLPGSKVPEWFSLTNKGSSLSFIPHHDYKIRGLSLCVVYAFSQDIKRWPYTSYHDVFAVITNFSKRLVWEHRPMVTGIPHLDEDMIWLSYWKFENQVEGGDEMDIFVDAFEGFQVKDVGVRLFYNVEKAEEITQQVLSTSEEVSDGIYRYGVAVPGNASSHHEHIHIFHIGKNLWF